MKLILAQDRLNAQQIAPLVRDALRFLRCHRKMIEAAPLQVYSSALIFSPIRSKLRKIFENEIPKWVTVKSTVEADWDSCLETLHARLGHATGSFAISADNRRLALGTTRGMIEIIALSSGANLQTIRGHGSPIGSISFSKDGRWLA